MAQSVTATTTTATTAAGHREGKDAKYPGKTSTSASCAAVEARRKTLVDHPLIAWLIENGCIFGLCCIHWFILRPRSPTKQRSFRQELLRSVASGLILIEGSILTQKVLIDRVYSHVPYFSELSRRTSRASVLDCFRDWATCNFPSHVLGSAVVSLALSGISSDIVAQRTKVFNRRRSGPLRFLARLAVARVIADFTFYAVHRLLHTRWLYGCIHKRHHEHKAPALVSNFHFTCADLVIEGFLPLFTAMGFLENVLAVIPHPFEFNLITLYIQWYEIGSHSGKAMPTVTYFPPLAPLYKWLLGDVDARNVEFHHLHHAKLACNYGITQWLDHALGTVRLDEAGEIEKQVEKHAKQEV